MATNKRGVRSKKRKLLAESPQFFKVIFSPVNQGIRIPTAFMKNYEDSLSKVVHLKVPTGVSWPVELLQTDYGTWLGNGWQEFAAYYAIKKRHFLVFRYDYNSQFHVIIFDASASEIEYPVESNHGHKEDHSFNIKISQVPKREEIESIVDDDDDVSIEFLGEEKPASQCQTSKRRKSGTNRKEAPVKIERENFEKLHAENVNWGRRHRSRQRIKEKHSDGTGMPCTRDLSPNASFPTLINRKLCLSYQRAKAFTSQNPFFVRFMQPYCLKNLFQLSFSLCFARRNLSKGKHCDLEFGVPERTKTWPVKCTMYEQNAKLCGGWKEFAEDNCLEVGDACVFELVRAATKIFNFNVIIFRNN